MSPAKAVDRGVVTVQPERWWAVVALGLISIAAGVLAVSYPDITLRVLGLALGIYLLIAAAAWVAIAVDESMSTAGETLRIVVGFLAALAGLICIVRPGASVVAVLLAVAFWFVMVGIADLARALTEPEGRIPAAVLGLVAIAIGVILVADPEIAVETVALIAGIGFIIRGSLEVLLGIFIWSRA